MTVHNYTFLAIQNQSSKPILNSANTTKLEESMHPNNSKIHQNFENTVDLDYYKENQTSTQELIENQKDFNNLSENTQNNFPQRISLSAFLKASQKLCSMTKLSGNLQISKGKFYVKYSKQLNSEKRIENSKWFELYSSAELSIDLNLFINKYILQIFNIESESIKALKNSNSYQKQNTRAKFTFILNYALGIKYLKSSEIGLPLDNMILKDDDTEIDGMGAFSQNMFDHYVIFWNPTQDEFEFINAENEDIECGYAFYFDKQAVSRSSNSVKHQEKQSYFTNIDILYLLKLCSYENESINKVRQELQESSLKQIESRQKKYEEGIEKQVQNNTNAFNKQKNNIYISSEVQKKKLSHLFATDEELYFLFNDL